MGGAKMRGTLWLRAGGGRGQGTRGRRLRAGCWTMQAVSLFNLLRGLSGWECYCGTEPSTLARIYPSLKVR